MYEHTLRVNPADLDGWGHVNNGVYVRWVEEVAVAHWEALTTPEIRAEVGWVLMRHEIDYLRPATLGEELIVRTAVEYVARLRVDRVTDVRRARDGEVLARSRTVWCPMDPRTGRPRRVWQELRELFAEPSPLPWAPPRSVPAPAVAASERPPHPPERAAAS